MLRQAGLDVVVNKDLTPDQLVREVAGFDALVVRGRTKVTGDILRSGDRLRVVARSGVGLDNIDLDTAKQRSIQVVSTPSAPTTSVAELTVALILAVLRRIPFADQMTKNEKWVKGELMGTELKACTVGIVGVAGRIGFEVARILIQGFGSKVVGYDVVDPSEKARAIGFEIASNLGDLLSKCDVVSIHVPYMPSTHHLIDAKAISRMKSGAILVNASRGDIVDGPALLEALKSGKLAAAGLDVFHREPPSDLWEKELTKLPNVVCTPHIGAQTVQCQRRESTSVAEQLIKILS